MKQACPSDAAAVHAVLVAAFTPYRHLYTPDCFDATVLDEARILTRMAEGPVFFFDGSATVSVKQDARGMYVRGLAVHPDAQGRGLGRRLLEHAEAHAREAGARCLWLSTTPFLHASIRLYDAFGFLPAHGPAHLHGTALLSFAKPLDAGDAPWPGAPRPGPAGPTDRSGR